ncbi:MAG: alpha/beta fold hydrolase [Lachnospirales bacterium]
MNKMNLKNGETIAYEDKGSGEKVLIAIHGNMSSSKHLDVLFENFPENLRIIVPDLRGFGESSYNEKVNSLEEYANDIIELIDALKIDKFSLLGWSTGGGIAMEIASIENERVQKLILIASVGTTGYPMAKLSELGQPIENEILKTREDVEGDTFRTIAIQKAFDENNRDFVKATWEAVIYTHNKPTPEKYEEYVSDVLTQKSIADVYYSLLSFNISNKHNGVKEGNNKISTIKADTLIIQGERDYVVPMEMALSIKEGLGEKAKLVTGDFGHSPFVDCPSFICETVIDFFK